MKVIVFKQFEQSDPCKSLWISLFGRSGQRCPQRCSISPPHHHTSHPAPPSGLFGHASLSARNFAQPPPPPAPPLFPPTPFCQPGWMKAIQDLLDEFYHNTVGFQQSCCPRSLELLAHAVAIPAGSILEGAVVLLRAGLLRFRGSEFQVLQDSAERAKTS